MMKQEMEGGGSNMSSTGRKQAALKVI